MIRCCSIEHWASSGSTALAYDGSDLQPVGNWVIYARVSFQICHLELQNRNVSQHSVFGNLWPPAGKSSAQSHPVSVSGFCQCLKSSSPDMKLSDCVISSMSSSVLKGFLGYIFTCLFGWNTEQEFASWYAWWRWRADQSQRCAAKTTPQCGRGSKTQRPWGKKKRPLTD